MCRDVMATGRRSTHLTAASEMARVQVEFGVGTVSAPGPGGQSYFQFSAIILLG